MRETNAVESRWIAIGRARLMWCVDSQSIKVVNLGMGGLLDRSKAKDCI